MPVSRPAALLAAAYLAVGVVVQIILYGLTSLLSAHALFGILFWPLTLAAFAAKLFALALVAGVVWVAVRYFARRRDGDPPSRR